MKTFLLIGLVLMVLALPVEPASAWYRHGYRGGYHPHGHSNFWVFIGAPVILVPPPPPVQYYYYRSYPPNDYYEYDRSDRVWAPGHWEYRSGPYGWERDWIPGHWEW
jgi:hypothetical protein